MLLREIDLFTMDELVNALKVLSKGKCADKHGVVLEMLAQGGDTIKHILLRKYNDVLQGGVFPSDWSELIFVMLPKSGDLRDAHNWRPVAILDVVYKVFAKMVHKRILPYLDPQISDEQMGFRTACGVDEALMTLECMVGASLEWNLPL